MKRLSLAAALCLAACSTPLEPAKPATSSRFAPGQVWRYKTRPGEKGSRVVIGKVEAWNGGNVVHVKIIGLKLKNRHRLGGISEEIGHVPITEKALAASVTAKVDEKADLDGLEAGYAEWKSHRGGAFDKPVKDVVQYVEDLVSKGEPE